MNAKEYTTRGKARLYKGEYRGAMEDLSKALKQKPKTYELQFLKALFHIEEKEYEEALKILTPMLEEAPEATWLHHQLVEVYTELGNTKMANRHATLAEGLNLIGPSNAAEHYCKLAEAYRALSLESIDVAAKYYMYAIQRDTQLAEPYTYLGNVYFKKGNYIKATQYFELARDLAPKNTEIIKYYAQVCFFTRNSPLLHELSDELIALEPDNPEGYANKSMAYTYEEKTQPAIEYIEKALALDPTHTYFFNRYNYASLLYTANRDAEALNQLNYLIDELKQNDNYVFFEKRADVRRTLGDITGANQDIAIAKALRKNPAKKIHHTKV